jgi:hypothetical protein
MVLVVGNASVAQAAAALATVPGVGRKGWLTFDPDVELHAQAVASSENSMRTPTIDRLIA